MYDGPKQEQHCDGSIDALHLDILINTILLSLKRHRETALSLPGTCTSNLRRFGALGMSSLSQV